MKMVNQNKVFLLILSALILIVSSFSVNAVLNDAYMYYSCDVNSTIDSTGLRNGTEKNGASLTSIVAGALNNACHLDNSDELEFGKYSFSGNNDWTACYWLNDTSALTDSGNGVTSNYGVFNTKFLFNYLREGSGNCFSKMVWMFKDSANHVVKTCQTEVNVSDSNWHHICYIFNGANDDFDIYVDSVNRTTVNDSKISVMGTNIVIDSAGTNGHWLINNLDANRNSVYSTLEIDEWGLWNRTLSGSEISELYNSGNGYNPYDAASSTLDILFRNESSDYLLNIAGEGENFQVLVNWTDDSDNSAFNDTVGNCTAIIDDGIVEKQSVQAPFTLCRTANCDFKSYTENFTGLTVSEGQRTLFHADFAHTTVYSGIVTVNLTGDVDCDYQEVIQPSEYAGEDINATVFVNTTQCANSTWIFLNLTGDLNNNGKKVVQNIHVDRELNSVSELMNFDGSLQLWNSSFYDYYKHGVKAVNVSCFHDSDSRFDNSVEENLTVKDAPPIVVFEQVNTSLGITDLVDGINIEYSSGIWNIFFSIMDDDAAFANFSVYNSSGYNLYTISGVPSTLNISIPNETFLDFANPYSFNFSEVNDTGGNVVNASLVFSVNDTVFPNASINSPANESTIYVGNSFNISAEATDEALWYFNLSVINQSDGSVLFSNGTFFPSVVTSYSLTTFFADASDFGVGNFTVNLTVKDAHTAKDLVDVVQPAKPFLNTAEFGFDSGVVSVALVNKGELTGFDVVRKSDRYSFSIQSLSGKSVFVFKIFARDIRHVTWGKYADKCHLILDRTHWFDADMPGLESCDVVLKNGYAVATAVLSSPVKAVVTNSLGELNVLSVLQEFEVVEPVADVDWSGVECGEKYASVNHNFSFAGQGLTNCSLRNNDYFLGSVCGNYSFTGFLGWNHLELTALLSNGTAVSSACDLWLTDTDLVLADWMPVVVMLFILLAALWFSFRIPIIGVIGGIFGLFFAYQTFALNPIVTFFIFSISVLMLVRAWLGRRLV